MNEKQPTQSGSHERLQARDKTKIGSDRMFGVVFAGVFMIVALFPLLDGNAVRSWAIAVAALLLAAALFRPGILRPANRLWARIGLLLHKITNPIILGAIFYVVITPIGQVMRMAGRDHLKLKTDADATSYWIMRDPPGPDPKGMSRQF